ncbi:MAG: small subunit ribosomal protein [Clostridiales bacterium]|jgi:small subunit ribosomal protein S4|nr:small subunit ribosomal protein [Clostridiales bacterium]
MARYTGANCRQCRREGQKLFLKGEKCYSDKCALVSRKEGAPGQHGQNRKKISEYGLQLRAKQKTKRYYGVLEGQFYHYFELAERRPGMAGENLLKILESRLDNVVYRLGYASSRTQARQLVTHGHFTVNGVRVNIPSYLVKENDVVAICDKSKALDSIKALVESNSGRPVPMWLESDKTNLSARVARLPNRDEIDVDVEEHLIVELYSK